MKSVLLLFLLSATLAVAQTNRPPDTLVSPQVLADGRVTFRIRAPKATEVGLFGDWMAAGTRELLTKDDQGVWSTTLGPLDHGISIYNFILDGLPMADPVNPRIKVRARTSASFVEVPGSPPELWEARDVPHGTVEVNWAKSAVTGDTRAYYVYTPPDYSRETAARYPVLYLLHGNLDTAAGWTDAGRAHFILDNLLAEKKAVPMIIVMPWGHAVPFDGPQTNNTAVFERYVIEEVMPQVDAKYRVAPGRENRAIVGLSMGGGHALQIGLSHLDRFSAVGAFSSAIPPNFATRFKSLLDQPEETNARLKLLWIGCGRQDPAFVRNEELAGLLKEHGVRVTFNPTEGRHNFAVWRRYLVAVAPLLFREGGK